MKTKQELLDLVLTGLWHLFLICIAVALGALLISCASRAPAPDTRTDNEKRLDQLEYQQRIQQMNNLLNT